MCLDLLGTVHLAACQGIGLGHPGGPFQPDDSTKYHFHCCCPRRWPSERAASARLGDVMDTARSPALGKQVQVSGGEEVLSAAVPGSLHWLSL